MDLDELKVINKRLKERNQKSEELLKECQYIFWNHGCKIEDIKGKNK